MPSPTPNELVSLRLQIHPTLLRFAAGELDAEAMKSFACRYTAAVQGAPAPRPTASSQLLMIVVNEKHRVAVYAHEPHTFENARLAAEWLLRACVGDEAAERGSYDFAREIESRDVWHLTAQQVREWAGRQSFT